MLIAVSVGVGLMVIVYGTPPPGQLRLPEVVALARKVIVWGVVEELPKVKAGIELFPELAFKPVILAGTFVVVHEINALEVDVEIVT